MVSATTLFYPVVLSLVSIIMAIMFVQPFIYAALFIQIAAVVCIFMIVDHKYTQLTGALRYLALVSIGVPFILMAGWQIEMYQVSPDDNQLLAQAAWMLGVGLLILLAVVPFHSSAVIDAPDLTKTLVYWGTRTIWVLDAGDCL